MIFHNAQYLEHRDPRPHALPTSLGKFSHIRLRNIATCNKKRPFARFLALPDPSKLIESIEKLDWSMSLSEMVADMQQENGLCKKVPSISGSESIEDLDWLRSSKELVAMCNKKSLLRATCVS
jgi:hypothetical protein